MAATCMIECCMHDVPLVPTIINFIFQILLPSIYLQFSKFHPNVLVFTSSILKMMPLLKAFVQQSSAIH